MKKPQYITILVSAVILLLLFFFGKTVTHEKHSLDDGHDHSAQSADNQDLKSNIAIDSLLSDSKKSLPAEQGIRLELLEKSITRGDVKDQLLARYSTQLYSLRLVHCRRSKIGKFRKKPHLCRPSVFERASATAGS